jgi:hypothetical protein
MLFAQESAGAPQLSLDGTPSIAILVPAAFCALLVLFVVLLLRHLRFTREKLHAERLKMIDAGYPLEEPESTRRRQQYMHNAFWISFWMVALVPSAAFSAAASATDRMELAGYIIAIWIGASAASVAAVVCAAVLMICSRCSREDGGDAKIPMKKPKALD